MRRLVPALFLVTALAAAGCSSSDKAGEEPAATTTPSTLAPAEAAQAYTEPGPYSVGITTLELAGGVKVEVSYPAVKGASGTDSYDLRKIIPPGIRDLLTTDTQAIFTFDAARDADVADGKFPLVLFSHGYTGIRQQSTFLTAHLASWGMIVAAPDHWSRDMFHTLNAVLGVTTENANDSVDDLRLTRELIEKQNADTTSRFSGHVDTEQVAAVGHSAGGGSVLGLANDTENPIDGYVSMASGILRNRTTSTTALNAETPKLPDMPSFFLAGSLDEIADPETATKPAFEAAPAPSLLWIVEGAGHNAFDDFCTLGGGKGIIGLAEESGLGPFLDSQPQFRALGEDGCLKPAEPVETTFPIINHSVTAWLRSLFGVDPAPVGLGPDVEGEYAVPVAITEKS
ncbi:MAG TPA: dienelactone hydrolase family protein [Acidimicrobiia bacterium]|nr:dienelactone hydrolase family protein [Acidimicrobiia bacterium]